MFRVSTEIKVLTGSAHRQLAERICAYIGVPLGDATVTSFPDGETYVKVNENIRGRDVFIVQPTCPPTNQNLMELLIMVDAVRRASAARITAVIPFFGYARQDRKDQPRVPITAKLIANLLTAAGVNRVLTMDLHAQQVAGFFDIPVDHLYAAPVIVRKLQSRDFVNPVVVSPDVGGLKMASAYVVDPAQPMEIPRHASEEWRRGVFEQIKSNTIKGAQTHIPQDVPPGTTEAAVPRVERELVELVRIWGPLLLVQVAPRLARTSTAAPRASSRRTASRWPSWLAP
jgi:hypothetical protein